MSIHSFKAAVPVPPFQGFLQFDHPTQGASPGNKYGNSGSPERAKQLVSVL